MGNIKKMISVILVVVCVFAFTACGKTETLDGKWVLVKSETSDGKTYKVKGEDTKEIYEISGDTATFYYSGKAMGDKTINLQVYKKPLQTACMSKAKALFSPSLSHKIEAVEGKR